MKLFILLNSFGSYLSFLLCFFFSFLPFSYFLAIHKIFFCHILPFLFYMFRSYVFYFLMHSIFLLFYLFHILIHFLFFLNFEKKVFSYISVGSNFPQNILVSPLLVYIFFFKNVSQTFIIFPVFSGLHCFWY